MRLFVAIELSDRARRAIGDAQDRLRASFDRRGVGAPRWVRPEHMHLTLAFLGEVGDTLKEAVVEVMERPIKQEPFQVVFGGLGLFPPAGAPRVLWLGLEEGTPSVITLQREVTRRVTELGIPLEQRTFHPHLTLARWRAARPSDGRHALDERVETVARLQVTGVALIESRLSSQGSSYTSLCEALLSGNHRPPVQFQP